MEIKIFESHDRERLTAEVNKFIAGVEVVDIQLKIRSAPNDQFTKYILLLQYK